MKVISRSLKGTPAAWAGRKPSLTALRAGDDKRTIADNVRELMRRGFSKKQAVAVALKNARGWAKGMPDQKSRLALMSPLTESELRKAREKESVIRSKLNSEVTADAAGD